MMIYGSEDTLTVCQPYRLEQRISLYYSSQVSAHMYIEGLENGVIGGQAN